MGNRKHKPEEGVMPTSKVPKKALMTPEKKRKMKIKEGLMLPEKVVKK
jgi:hypothetical protein